MTKEEIIAAIRKLTEELGRAPSREELSRASGATWHQIYSQFGGMLKAVRAAGLEPGSRGYGLSEREMVLDWGRVVRELGRLPNRGEYDKVGRRRSTTLHNRMDWSQMAHRFVLLVREFHVEEEWKDVVELVVRRFPLLGKEQSGHRGTESRRTARQESAREAGLMAADASRLTPIEGQQVGRELTRVGQSAQQPAASIQRVAEMARERRDGEGVVVAREARGRGGRQIDWSSSEWDSYRLRLGKAVSAALAIEILMAAQVRSTQPSAAGHEGTAGMAGDGEDKVLVAGAGTHGENREQEGEFLPPMPQTIADQGGLQKWRVREMTEYGDPLDLAVMAHAPTNEAGVVFLFGALAARLGFRVERLQTGFPDCEAKRQVRPGVWQRVRVEFEFESRSFRNHRHDAAGCDVMVCWRHNWPECPEELEVVELMQVVANL